MITDGHEGREYYYTLHTYMSLPIRFRNVHYYRIAGKYIFAGDLFITRKTLYFFPEIDLEEQRDKVTRELPRQLALLALLVIYFTQKFGRSYSSRIEFWQKGLAPEQFEKHAGVHVDKLKAERARASFGETLPLPTCISANEVADLKLSATGRLSFVAQSDKHDFNIGLFRKNQLRDALWEAGLGRV